MRRTSALDFTLPSRWHGQNLKWRESGCVLNTSNKDTVDGVTRLYAAQYTNTQLGETILWVEVDDAKEME